MFIQELYYVTTGKFPKRKKLRVIYALNGAIVHITGQLKDGDLKSGMPPMHVLPALNVTPAQFKDMEEKLSKMG